MIYRIDNRKEIKSMKIFDVIEFLPTPEVREEWLMYHVPGHTFNSKSKLRVQPGQVAICVNSGKVEHVFGEDTGTVDLTTANFPFLSKLIAKVAYGGDYPYDMQIYYLNINNINAIFCFKKLVTVNLINCNLCKCLAYSCLNELWLQFVTVNLLTVTPVIASVTIY
mgnify:CR=1 FL=1